MNPLKRRAPDQAKALRGQVDRWASRIGVRPVRIQIQHMAKKWASCSPGGRICLSKDLLGEDTSFQQVVIVHELLHLRVPNHGKLFKGLMNAYLPGWEKAANERIKGETCRDVQLALGTGAGKCGQP